jgi:predicted GNAT superfamily acetyltransferase
MNDAINAGDFTDRAVVHWDLHASDRDVPGDTEIVLASGADGLPVVEHRRGPALRVFVPEDAVAMRKDDPAAARAWRLALRETFGAAIAEGYVAHSMTRDGWYTLTRTSG